MTPPIKKTKPTPEAEGLKCPTCDEAAAPPAVAGGKSPRPFCSARCAEVDLGRWFRGQYAIPAVDAADDTIVDAMIAETETAQGRREE
tara:strand:+ start:727 stop:990 length:264 start_codon:yes stop_codon:yes gene_type:complete